MILANGPFRTNSDGEPLLRCIATAIVRMSKSRFPSDPVYDDVTQRALNHLVLLCLRKNQTPPASVPEMMKWASSRPLGDWPLTLDGCDLAEGQLLVDAETQSPTQFCMEWAMISVGDPSAEQFENSLMGEALSVCKLNGSPDSYVSLRRLFIERPVMTESELGELSSDVVLLPLLSLIRRSYQPAPASCLHRDQFYTCSRCGCLLIPTRTGQFRCDLDRCLREGGSSIARKYTRNDGGGIRQLARPLRLFITGPGLAEIALESALKRLGIEPEMWPSFDSYDLRIALPDGRIWAVDVKDRANPALLARTAVPFRTTPAFTRAFLVFPAYRVREREDYERVFQRNLAPELAETFQACTDKVFLRLVRQELGRSPQKGGSNA